MPVGRVGDTAANGRIRRSSLFQYAQHKERQMPTVAGYQDARTDAVDDLPAGEPAVEMVDCA